MDPSKPAAGVDSTPRKRTVGFAVGGGAPAADPGAGTAAADAPAAQQALFGAAAAVTPTTTPSKLVAPIDELNAAGGSGFGAPPKHSEPVQIADIPAAVVAHAAQARSGDTDGDESLGLSMSSSQPSTSFVGSFREMSLDTRINTPPVGGPSALEAVSPPKEPAEGAAAVAAAVAVADVATAPVAAPAPAPVPTAAPVVAPAPAPGPDAQAGGKQGKQGKKEKKEKKVKEVRLPEGGIVPKPKLTKAERRAMQEAQRAAKAARLAGEDGGGKGSGGKGGGSGGSGSGAGGAGGSGGGKAAGGGHDADKKAQRPSIQQQHDVAKKGGSKSSAIERPESAKQIALFAHLPQYEAAALRASLLAAGFAPSSNLHPAVVKLGLQFSQGLLTGANQRSEAMLEVFKQLVRDYHTPKAKTLARDLSTRLKHSIDFLSACRPLSVSMGNAIKYVKKLVVNSPLGLPESEAKSELVASIDWFLTEKIQLARRAVVEAALTKIRDGDVLLTFAWADSVEEIFVAAKESGRSFRVVLVDSSPKLECQELTKRLVARGLKVTYCHLTAVSYIMREVTKVFIGASYVCANGTVVGRNGAAAVAMVAKCNRVPVMVCCETYKFSERVQLDAITSNELANPDDLADMVLGIDAGSSKKADKKYSLREENGASGDKLRLLNLSYDAMPPEFCTMIITELGMLPASAVPAVLREAVLAG